MEIAPNSEMTNDNSLVPERFNLWDDQSGQWAHSSSKCSEAFSDVV